MALSAKDGGRQREPADDPAPAAKPASGVGAAARPLTALKERVRALVESWAELQGEAWNAMAAMAHYEELERISASADELGQPAIAEPALALTVYLSTFVEGRLYPSNAQRQKLDELVERLHAQVEGGPRPPGARERALERRTVLYLRAPEREMAGLAAQLGRHRYVVRPCETLAQAIATAEESLPEALLVDVGASTQLDELLDHVDKVRGEAKGRAVCLVTGTEVDAAHRLHALRIGADAVLETADADQIATRMDELIAQQRNLDYRVLVVEDDRSQALFCETVLRHRGISARICPTGEEALEAIGEFRPDLVVLDLYLPGINGIEVAQILRERAEHAFLPIVFLSGETDLDKRFDAIRMGGDDFITKPVKPRHLIAEVETRIRRARQLPQRTGVPARNDRRGALVARSVLVDAYVDPGSDFDQPRALVLVAPADAEVLRDRLGFVACGNLAQQLAAAVTAEAELWRPVCAAGEFSFIGLIAGADLDAIRARLEQLRERLESRRWGPPEDPLKLAFVVSGAIADPDTEKAEDVVVRLRRRSKDALAGQAGCVLLDVPRRRAAPVGEPAEVLARTLLRGQLIPESVSLEYQALVPLAGELYGQYCVRVALVPPKSSQRVRVPAERMRAIAREMGVAAQVERQCVRRILSELTERTRRGDSLRLLVPVGIESALDAAFAPWLAAELQGRALAPASLVLELDASEVVRQFGAIGAAIESLQLVGVRLAVRGLEGGESHLRLARHPSFALIKLEAPNPAPGAVAPWGAERGRLVVEAGKHGKVVVACDVRDAREMSELLKLGVHYVQADMFAPWSATANFDFAGN